MKLFVITLLVLGTLVVKAEEKKSENRTPAQTSRKQTLFDRVEINSGEDSIGNQIGRIIDRDKKTVCYTYRMRTMEGTSISCLPLVE